ncbi:hypothetical protein GCM10011389_08240 [Pontibacillus salipaludis]|uniref:Uncharacterized protein n=1 Tax=Pontibacillus salipaludis TaxID=1697394 RepID=A0ABQ1PT90_9BACI|nr:hypothetical protein GCM10011389_08240 [Pontibacillus salipaludis]
MFDERLGLLGDNSLSCGELGSLLNRYALCGVFPRLLFPRESRRPRASPGFNRGERPRVRIRRSDVTIYGMFSFILIWQRLAWKLRDSRGQKSQASSSVEDLA